MFNLMQINTTRSHIGQVVGESIRLIHVEIKTLTTMTLDYLCICSPTKQ